MRGVLQLVHFLKLCHVCNNMMLSCGSVETNLGFEANISKNMQGVNMLVGDKGGDRVVMTSLLCRN